MDEKKDKSPKEDKDSDRILIGYGTMEVEVTIYDDEDDEES